LFQSFKSKDCDFRRRINTHWNDIDVFFESKLKDFIMFKRK
jgi:hypothetical protein